MQYEAYFGEYISEGFNEISGCGFPAVHIAIVSSDFRLSDTNL